MNLLHRHLTALLIVFLAAPAVGQNKPIEQTTLDDLKYIEGNEAENEKRAAKTELLVAASEKRALAQLKVLIRKHKGTYIEADLWFRMAELHMRRSKTERFFELHRESATVVKLAPKKVRKASSKREVVKAVGIYEKLQRNFRKFDKMDLVIFNNAFARQTLGQTKTAARLYADLIKLFPRSPLVPDAHLAIGEIQFDKQKFQVALKHFLAIEKYPRSRVYPYGMYKAAWTFYNLRKEDLGLKKLEEVVAFGKMVEEKNIDSRLDLRKEALADMTIFFEDVYPSSKAYSYFSEQAGKLPVTPVVLKLAYIYDRHSRWQDKLTVLTDLMNKQPYAKLIPEVHDQLIWNYENMKKRDLAVKQMEKFYSTCEPDSRWTKKQFQAAENDYKIAVEAGEKGLNKPKLVTVAESCQKMINATSLKLAGKWLRTWKKNKGYPVFADSAEAAYAIYLRKSQPTKVANKARFTYAELLFQRNKFREASAQYALTAENTTEKKLKHDSGYAALLSLEKAVGNKWSTSDEELFKKLAKSYVAANPDGEFRLDIEFKIGLIAYEKERYDEAAPIFLGLGRKYGKTEKGLKAQDLYLDILNIKKDYAALTAFSKELLGVGGSKERLDKLSKVYQQAWFLQIQNMEENKEYAKAITEYQKFTKENPKSFLAEKAWWNVTQLLYKTLRYNEAAASSLTFYNKYPTAKQAQDALLKAAQTYESLGQLRDAVVVLKKLMKVDAANSEKWMALAADFSFLSSQNKQAKKWYKKLLNSEKPEVASKSLEQLLKIAEQENDQNAIKKYQAEALKQNVQPRASLVQLDKVEVLYKSGQNSDAFIQAKKVLNMGKTASKYAKSRARFIQARILEDEFRKQSVKTRVERVALVLGMKTEKLEKAQRAYQSAMRYGDPYVAVESLQRLAGLYQTYVNDLKTMPLPKGLTANDEPTFRGEISQLSIPLEEKSVETMAKALEAAKDLEMRDGTIAELRQKLDALNMKPNTRLKLKIEPAKLSVPVVKGLGS